MREKLSMDFAWRFHIDDMEYIEDMHHMYVYHRSKGESGRAQASPSFYDLDWELVDIPHDYVIDEKPDQKAVAAHGFKPRKNAWYRRPFRINEKDKGKRIIILFDGVATHCKVWVNGHLMHRNFCGYTSFEVDITDVANYGDPLNLISVYVDTSDHEGWWYEGGGIYRHVWMIKTSDVSVDTWGTFVKTEKSDGSWKANIETTLRNDSYNDRSVKLVSKIIDDNENEIASVSDEVILRERDKQVCTQTINADGPKLWSVDTPNLYNMISSVMEDGKEIDSYVTQFGFREIEFSSETGFWLNGENIKLKGVCAHEDQSNLGVALPDEIREERIKILKSIGCNAYRCGHRPPAPEMLDFCDRYGLLVMDENRWFDSSPEGLNQLENMIVRDRNHPSVIIWSLGNEEPLDDCDRGRRIMAAMRNYAHKLDDSRPATLAMCQASGLLSENASVESDIIGINYNQDKFDQIHEMFPEKPLVVTEIGGKFNQLHMMGDASGEDWKGVNTRPFMMGMFKWVGFGYRGEARGWPRLFSRSGIIDINAIPKENTYFYKAMWSKEDFVKIYPFHWNWEGNKGDAMEVNVYTSADEVELFLNGKSQGRKTVDIYERTKYTVEYQPGVLKAIAYKKGAQTASDVIETTGRPAKLMLTYSREELNANRRDVLVLTASAVDEKGRKVLWSNDSVSFDVKGDVEILAVCNSDAYEHLGPKVPQRKLHKGTCQLVLRTKNRSGILSVCAAAKGMESARYETEIKQSGMEKHVPIEQNVDSLIYFAKME